MFDVNVFHDERFPTDIAFGAQSSVVRPTDIVTLGSGHEQRNQRWRHSRRKFDAGLGIKSLEELYDVMDFFEARRGAQHPFRFRDPLDWKSCKPKDAVSATDQWIGEGDGETAEFSLMKSYGTGPSSYARQIQLPIDNTIVVAVDGTVIAAPQISHNDGVITFANSAIPQTGQVITAGYEFDVPVRFADDELTVNLAAFDAGEVPSVLLVEVRL